MSLTITNPTTLTGSQRAIGIKVVTTRTESSKWIECKMTVDGTTLTTFNTFFGSSNTVYVYPQKMLSYTIDWTVVDTSVFDATTDTTNLLNIWNIEFTEKYISSGTVNTGATQKTNTFYSIDARRNIEDSDLSDYIAGSSSKKWLTDRTKIQLNESDFYLLTLIQDSSEDLTLTTYEGATLKDTRDITKPTSGYQYVTYNVIGGSAERTVKVYKKGTTDKYMADITIQPRVKCAKVRVIYRNRLGAYDIDYITAEKKRQVQRDIFRKSLPYSYTYYTDRELTQVGIDETRTGTLYTEKMSDLHAYQIATSKDVYLYDASNSELVVPIVVDTKEAFTDSFTLRNFKFNFKYSNI